MLALLRIVLGRVVGKQPLLPRRSAPLGQSDNDHVNVRHAACVRSPRKGAMREGDVQLAAVQQDRPKLRNLFALGDGIGRHKADSRRALLYVFAGLDKPRGNVVERAAAFAQRGDAAHLFALRGRLEFRAHKRRIAEHVGTCLRPQQFAPVHLQRIAMHNVRRLLQRNARVRLAKLQAQPVVHNVIHHPQRDLGDVRREFPQFNAVKLVHIDH